jgi:hypothetical protein
VQDFIFTDPNFASCLSSEFNYGFVATLTDRREGYRISEYGGVLLCLALVRDAPTILAGAIVTLRNRSDIRMLTDLVNKRIATRTIVSIADFGMHAREMIVAGIDPMMTSQQVCLNL